MAFHLPSLHFDPHDDGQRSRVSFIIEAALEYFVAIMITGAFLAKLTSHLGVSDSLTGILSAFLSLGHVFQLFSMMVFRNHRRKRKTLVLQTINQVLVMLLYITPFFPLSQIAKVVIFVVFLVASYVLLNLVSTPKIQWRMSYVPDHTRGRFTANMEIISLLGGMIFTFIMGSVFDAFEAQNNMEGAFIVGAITLFILMVLHVLTLVFCAEMKDDSSAPVKTESIFKRMYTLWKNPAVRRVTLVSSLWTFSTHLTTPFLGTYQIHELGFSMTFVSVLGIVYSIVRSLASRPIGRFADKHSFARSVMLCYSLAMVTFALYAFTTPANGMILYTTAYAIFAISQAGTVSAETNLIMDYIPFGDVKDALAMKYTISGLVGFLTTLLASPIVEWIQQSGNQVFGLPIYAQQFMAILSLIMTAVVLLYMRFAILKLPRVQRNSH